MPRRELWHFVPFRIDISSSAHSDEQQVLYSKGSESILHDSSTYGSKIHYIERTFHDSEMISELNSLGLSLSKPVQLYSMSFRGMSFAFLRIVVDVNDLDIFNRYATLAQLRTILDNGCFRNSVVPVCTIRSSMISKQYITMSHLDDAIKAIADLEVIKPYNPTTERWVKKGETTMVISPYYAWVIGRTISSCIGVGKEIEAQIGKIIGESFGYHWNFNRSITFVIVLGPNRIGLMRAD